MPVSYAVQRSLPTSALRRVFSASKITSTAMPYTPTQMGQIGFREKDFARDIHHHEILEQIHQEVTCDNYKSFEIDWLLALEKRKPFPFNHRALSCKIRCWHGMDDDVSPIGAAMWMQREMKEFLLFAVEGIFLSDFRSYP